MVDPVESAVGAEFLRRDSQIYGLQECVGRGSGLRPLRG